MYRPFVLRSLCASLLYAVAGIASAQTSTLDGVFSSQQAAAKERKKIRFIRQRQRKLAH